MIGSFGQRRRYLPSDNTQTKNKENYAIIISRYNCNDMEANNRESLPQQLLMKSCLIKVNLKHLAFRKYIGRSYCEHWDYRQRYFGTNFPWFCMSDQTFCCQLCQQQRQGEYFMKINLMTQHEYWEPFLKNENIPQHILNFKRIVPISYYIKSRDFVQCDCCATPVQNYVRSHCCQQKAVCTNCIVNQFYHEHGDRLKFLYGLMPLICENCLHYNFLVPYSLLYNFWCFRCGNQFNTLNVLEAHVQDQHADNLFDSLMLMPRLIQGYGQIRMSGAYPTPEGVNYPNFYRSERPLYVLHRAEELLIRNSGFYKNTKNIYVNGYNGY